MSARIGSRRRWSRRSSPDLPSSTRTITSGTGRAGATCWTSCWPTSRSGHDVRATVFVQCRAPCTAPTGRRRCAPVGETEFANGVAAMSASGSYGKMRACAGIVGACRPALGDAGAAGAGGAYPRRRRPLPRHPPHRRLGRRSRHPEPGLHAGGGHAGHAGLPRRLRASRAARPLLRRLALPPPDPAPGRAGARLPGTPIVLNHCRRHRSASARYAGQARRGLRGLGGESCASSPPART